MIIQERIDKTNKGFVTDYAGDIINFMVNKPKIYRITYYPRLDVYAICDGYNNSHTANYYSMKELGYDSNEETLLEDDICFLFVPTEFIDDKEKWEVEGFGNERAYLTPITTGYIVTYDSYTLHNDMYELYEILKRRHLLVDIEPKGDVLFPELNLNNFDAYNYIAVNALSYKNGHSSRLIMGTPEKQINALRQLKLYIDTHKPPKDFVGGYWVAPEDVVLDDLEQSLKKRYVELNDSILKLKIRETTTW